MKKAKGTLDEMPAEYRREDLGPTARGKLAARYSKTTTSEASAKPALGRGLRAQRGVRLTMRVLREAVGKTQLEVASASRIDQADISRLERKESFDDCQVSTMQRYISALGGHLDLVAVFGDKKIVLAAVKAGPRPNG